MNVSDKLPVMWRGTVCLMVGSVCLQLALRQAMDKGTIYERD